MFVTHQIVTCRTNAVRTQDIVIIRSSILQLSDEYI